MPKVDFYMENGKLVLGKRAEQLDMFGGEKDLMRFAAESKWSEIFNLRITRPKIYEPMLSLRTHTRCLYKAIRRLEESREWQDDYRRALRAKDYHSFYAAKSLRAVVELI